jgi:integrase
MPRRAAERLTDKLIRALPKPGSGAVITYDADVPGFGIRVTKNDVRSFVLNYVVAGRERRLTIGRFPTWSATAAREEAKAHRRKVDAKIDPLEERAAQELAAAAERSAPTVRDLFERYKKEHLPHKRMRSAADDRSMWEKIILPRLGDIKVSAVRSEQIDALHAEIGATRPVRANRVVEVIRKAFNLAIRWGWREDNPARGVRRNQEERRARYLSSAELIRLSEALAQHPEKASVNAIKWLMLTGARRGEVLGARWDMFDLEARVWVKPSAHTKQNKEHRVPLSVPAVQVLKLIKKQAEEALRTSEHRENVASRYVFPAIGGKPISDVKRTWLAVCRKAGLAAHVPKKTKDGAPAKTRKGEPIMAWQTSVRLHDLRHTYASILASQGLSLPIIGALLGHTQSQTTARYAHLLDDPLRAATEQVGALMTLGTAAMGEAL